MATITSHRSVHLAPLPPVQICMLPYVSVPGEIVLRAAAGWDVPGAVLCCGIGKCPDTFTGHVYPWRNIILPSVVYANRPVTLRKQLCFVSILRSENRSSLSATAPEALILLSSTTITALASPPPSFPELPRGG